MLGRNYLSRLAGLEVRHGAGEPSMLQTTLKSCHLCSGCAMCDGSLLSLSGALPIGASCKGNGRLVQELPCLEVLDLHSNLMETMDGISTLVSLRLLNLSGNRIRHLSNIKNLSALAELNLGRNFIASMMPPEEVAAREVCRRWMLM